MKRSGFGLIELIVVISLISIIAGFFTFFFSGILDQIKIQSAAKLIASDIRSVRMLAYSSHSTQDIVFERDRYFYAEHLRVLPSPVLIKNPQTVKFAASGLPQPGYFGTLKLILKSKTISIIISPLGRVRIE